MSFSEETETYLLEEAYKEQVPLRPIPPNFATATVLRLIRALAF